MVPVSWHKPPDGKYKLNIDGSYEPNSSNGGTGGVIRDHLGTWIVGFTRKIIARNALHAEVLALLHGLNLAKSENLKHLPVETDSQVLLNTLYSNNLIYSHIFADCRSLLLQLEGSSLKHIPKEANAIADLLAKNGRETKDPYMINNQTLVFEASPSPAIDVLERDVIGTVTHRLVPLLYG